MSKATDSRKALSPRQQGSRAAAGQLSTPGWALGLGVALAFSALRWSSLHQLPVWDGAMGVVPAAITLEAMGFDLIRLLEMPAYNAGGPNTHALCTYTWFVAALIRLTGGYVAALPYLHIVSFCLVGVLASGTYRAALAGGLSNLHALMATALAVVFPPMVVQGSDVYLDLPLAAAITWAFAFALESRWRYAIAAACIAGSLKPSALVVVPAMAVLMLLDRPIRIARLGLLAIPSLIAVSPVMLDRALRDVGAQEVMTVAVVTSRTLVYLATTPVLFALLLTVFALFLLNLVSQREIPQRPVDRRLFLGTVAFAASYVAFFSLSPLASKGVPSLPRYTTMLAPILVVGFLSESTRRFGRTIGLGSGAVLLAYFLVNLNGRFDPSSRNLYPLAERSLTYERFLSVQKEAYARFLELVEIMPTYYDHFTYFRLAYPQSGWGTADVLSGTPIWITPVPHWRDPANLPDRFAMLIEADWLGGEELLDVKERALASPDWSVDVEVFAEGEFNSEVVIVSRR